MPKVTVVCGPPGSGKTTYVARQRGENDVIVDYDALMAAITGLAWYQRPPDAQRFVMAARAALLQQLREPSAILRGWVIVSAPRRLERDDLRRQLQANVVVLAEPEHVCVGRIAGDARRSAYIEHWRGIIRSWWSEYEPDPADLVLSATPQPEPGGQ